ncbi:amino acid permease family protein [Nitrobacter sp. Nb-311A]|uniref:APC family permease n=1 Tax=unclassified Nitrobacter TaxID=2620411 RepID=UPI0000684EE5|nr:MULTISPECIES: APC family permease [unclassified Nitrobacter]EAQ34281.1 amino acid permease family protein [Nitrobacter sp. Nb-311A]MCB1394132.1 amino acid permease [Nitrobacter sp.]MCV0387359.1 APC family permease [Nitrobacter sp.]
MTGENPQRLRRDLGVGGATMLGLGSMVGTGVFVSIGIAAGAAGPATILAIVLAALVATCNALSSAQLATAHAVSGGTYEYGYRYLTPSLGFTAGWMFLCSKTASAATAALGFSGYLLRLVGGGEAAMPWVAFSAVVLFTLLVLAGLKRSSAMNIAIVSVTLLALSAFVAFGLPTALRTTGNFFPFFPATDGPALHGFFYATALMFVAYTGYARIATLGEEVKEPRTSIPHAIMVTLTVTAALYVLVAVVAIGTVGADRFAGSVSERATPLESVARALDVAFLPQLIAIGAVMAMLGVLLNLIIGLSRVVLAMGRRGDAPPLFARLSRDGRAPTGAVILVGLAVGGLALTGSVETTWAFSAFTVLIYYAVTNLAALRLPPEDRLYPRWVAIIGLIACLFLAFWVPITIWVAGLGLILIGLAWKTLAPRLWTATNRSTLS